MPQKEHGKADDDRCMATMMKKGHRQPIAIGDRKGDNAAGQTRPSTKVVESTFRRV
ncbi:hypothetical protein [Prevotella pectinovora]|uniref:hypothetical protein n=1 Tax=Prevotella pectinovora TaxID=1602169 RepID=UPI002591B916|nr:hypothetical protein [uncultured Prevotella sp.]